MEERGKESPSAEPERRQSGALDTSQMDTSGGILNVIRAQSSVAYQDATERKIAKFSTTRSGAPAMVADTSEMDTKGGVLQMVTANADAAAERKTISLTSCAPDGRMTDTSQMDKSSGVLNMVRRRSSYQNAEERKLARFSAARAESSTANKGSTRPSQPVSRDSNPRRRQANTPGQQNPKQAEGSSELFAAVLDKRSGHDAIDDIPAPLPAAATPPPTEPGAYTGAPGQLPERLDVIRRSLVGLESDDNDIMAEEETMGLEELLEDIGTEAPDDAHGSFAPNSSAGTSAIAELVNDDSEYMEAEPVDVDAAKRQQIQKKWTPRLTFLAIALLVVAASATVAFVFGSSPSKRELDATDNTPTTTPSLRPPSGAPSSAPTGALDALLDGLPGYTLGSLQSSSTPQWQALAWLENHPVLPSMPEWRKAQLFALATFYYSMDGDNWPEDIQQNWLQYDEDECLWFSGRFGSIEDDGSYVAARGYDLLGEPCNDQGVFETLILFFLGPFSNERHIPPEIGLLTDLSVLSLPLSHITGGIEDFLPSELYQMTRLSYINLHTNQLTGTIPTELTMMPSLNHLNLYANLLTSTIPSELGLISNMRDLFLDLNGFTGTICSELGLLSNMRELYLHSNQFHGTIPSQLGLMSNIDIMVLSVNALTGSIPSQLGMLSNMTQLWLNNNGFTGTICTELGLLSNIRELYLYSNQLQGAIPSQLGMLSNMTQLWLNRNYFLNGTIPHEAGAWSNMRELWLYSNMISGTLPSELGLMSNISQMGIYDNRLSGSIPSEFGLMTSIESFFVYQNKIDGTIPSELGLLTSLTKLSMRNNMLSGTIPSQLELLANLEVLRLEDNELTGPIPPRLGLAAANYSIQTMTLLNNSLTGTIAESLCSRGVFEDSVSMGLSFDCTAELCGCCWCPCPGSNYTGECQTNPFVPSRDNVEWPGYFPTPSNTTNAITVNIFTDSYPEVLSMEWSQLNETNSWIFLESTTGLSANSLNSWTVAVESESLYRLQLLDPWGDGVCCWYGLGWFTITGSSRIPGELEGSVIWEAMGYALGYALDVFIWVDANGQGHYVEYLPGIGYTLPQAYSDGAVVVEDTFLQNTTKAGNASEIEP